MTSNHKPVALPTYDYAFKNCDYRMLMVLTHKFDYTQPAQDKPYKILMKWRYKKYKKQMIKEYGKSSRTWDRNFKKMIKNGFIEECEDHYRIYNKNKDNKGYRLIPYEIVKSFISENISNSEIASYLLIFYKTYNYKLEECFSTHIPLVYFAKTLGTNEDNASRDYIGNREVGCYCEGAGILTRLEENGYITIAVKKDKCPVGNFNINNYFFKPILTI